MLEYPFQDRSDASSALDHVRGIVARCRENCRQITEATAPRPIRSVAVVGAGIMGSAIAIEHAKRSIPVVLMDKSREVLRSAEAAAAGELAAAERAGWRLPDALPITYTDDADCIAGCDLVLESIAEKRPVKQALYDSLRPRLSPSAILATNTSTIPIARLSAGLADPSRFCGLHFCHPVGQRPLVEVIPGPATSPGTLSSVVAHAVSIGKLPLVVSDGPGFIVNRLLLTYLNEALAALSTGISMKTIDAAMVEFGMPVGAIALLDEIGLDTALQSGIVLAEIFGERSRGTELLVRLVKARHLGRKVGAGFYIYPDMTPNPSVGEMTGLIHNRDPIAAEITRRLLRPMIAEAGRLLAEKMAASAGQIDLALIFGLGFPLWRGGLLKWASTSGL